MYTIVIEWIEQNNIYSIYYVPNLIKMEKLLFFLMKSIVLIHFKVLDPNYIDLQPFLSIRSMGQIHVLSNRSSWLYIFFEFFEKFWIDWNDWWNCVLRLVFNVQAYFSKRYITIYGMGNGKGLDAMCCFLDRSNRTLHLWQPLFEVGCKSLNHAFSSLHSCPIEYFYKRKISLHNS